MSSGEPTGPSPAQSAPSDSGPPDTAPPPARLPWWGGVLIAAVGLVFVLGMVHEQSTTAALLPPSDGWFSSGQTVSVPVSAGESKTVYWDFENEVRRVRATAKCVARDRQSGAAIALTPIGGDLRVDNRKALATMKPPRSGTVDLTCMAQGARRSQFGVAKEIPAPRPLNGVEAAGKGTGLALTSLALLVPACIVLALIPLRPAVRAWLFGFFAPLLFAVVLALGFNSVMPGLLLGVVWYAVLGFRRMRPPDRGRPHAPDRAVGHQPGPQALDTGEIERSARFAAAMGMAMFAVIAVVMLRWAHAALNDDNLPTAVVAGLAALAMVCMLALGVANLTGAAPRTEVTARGLEVRPARYVSTAIVVMSVSFVAAMALGALLYATGHLDFHPGDRGDRRLADKLFGLALALPFMIGIPYLPAIRTWIRGERKPWHRNPPVLLSAQGVQIERLGVVRYVPWDQVAGVRVVRQRYQRNLVIDVNDGPPMPCDKLSLLGSSWLVTTIRAYWQNPQARSGLGGARPVAGYPAAPPEPGYPAPPAVPPGAPAAAPPPQEASPPARLGRGSVGALALVGAVILGNGGYAAYRHFRPADSGSSCAVDGAREVTMNKKSAAEPTVTIPDTGGWERLDPQQLTAQSHGSTMVRDTLVNTVIGNDRLLTPNIVVTVGTIPDRGQTDDEINHAESLAMKNETITAQSKDTVCGNTVYRTDSTSPGPAGQPTRFSTNVFTVVRTDDTIWGVSAAMVTTEPDISQYIAQRDALVRGFRVEPPT